MNNSQRKDSEKATRDSLMWIGIGFNSQNRPTKRGAKILPNDGDCP